MDGPAEMRRCLEEVDVDGIRALWRMVAPEMPQSAADRDVEISIHYARTQSDWLRITQRFYSHRWLLDHAMLSGLPDHLRPSAERMYPRVVSAVGISINAQSAWLKPIVPLVRGAIENAVKRSLCRWQG